MKELPGDVFVGGQIDIVTLTALAEQGVMSFINNRPDNEGHMQPSSESLAKAAAELGVDYRHIPMFCASGMRSAALWAFASVKDLGVDSAMSAISDAGYNLEQIRGPLTEFAKAKE